MRVLIAKANQDIFLKWRRSMKFEEASKNTCIMEIPEKEFIRMREWLRKQGYNPFALMSW